MKQISIVYKKESKKIKSGFQWTMLIDWYIQYITPLELKQDETARVLNIFSKSP